MEAAGHEIRISSPSKVYFPKPGFTKLDLAEYYLAVADAAVNQLRERPGTMKRFVDGAAGEFFFQKRVPFAAAGIACRHLLALGGRRHRSKSVMPSSNTLWRNSSFQNYADYAATNAFRDGLKELAALARQRLTCACMRMVAAIGIHEARPLRSIRFQIMGVKISCIARGILLPGQTIVFARDMKEFGIIDMR